MRKWVLKSLALYDRDPASTAYQQGFRDALIQVRIELNRRAEDRKILIAKSGVAGAVAAVVLGFAWALFA